MAEQYDNSNRFALFNNKKTKETQPDYTGTINVDGRELRLSGWVRKSKAGVTYVSGTVQEVQAQESSVPDKSFEDMKDDVPF
jgi:hypothetical protein